MRFSPSMSGSMNRPTRIDMIRARKKARKRHCKDRFVVARGQAARRGLAQLLDKCRRQRLAKKALQQAVVQVRINAINNYKPLVTRDKRQVIGLPGLFDVDPLAEAHRGGSVSCDQCGRESSTKMYNPSTN